MLLQDFRKQAIKKLEELYGEREAKQTVDILLEDLLQLNRAVMLAQHDRILTIDEQEQLQQAVDRVMHNEPVQYITGQVNFYGLNLSVNPSVLIPRPETEELVEWVLNEHNTNETISLLDVGSGSGCIPLALKNKRPDWNITSIDASSNALKTAKTNAEQLNLNVNFMHLDFLAEETWKPMGKINLLVSNPPYITVSEFEALEPNVKHHEPEMALVAPGEDPFIFYRKLAHFGKQKLVKNGQVYLELNAEHAATIRDIFIQQGYSDVMVQRDMQGKDRMLRATLL